MNSMNRPLTPSLSPSEGERVAGGRVRGRFMVPMRGWKTVGTAMNVIQSLLVGLFFVCLFNCVNANDRSLLIRSLAKGALSGIKEAKQEVIRDAAAWERFRKQHSISEQSAERIPPVDFSKEMIVAATMGTKRTGGYTIEIVRVEPTEKSLKIFVKRTSPPPGALTIQALTAPFHFVAVSRSDLKPEFVQAKPAEKK